MKPINPEKEHIIAIVNSLLLRSELGIDQVVARMQIDGCTITRNTFENRFTTRVHQKPNIPPEWLLSFIRAFTENLSSEERCTPEEALMLFQLARLPLEKISDVQQFFPDQVFTSAIKKLIPISYATVPQSASNVDNLLTGSARKMSGSGAIAVQQMTEGLYREEWGNAPDINIVVGRQKELNQLVAWIQSGQCRLIGILGMIGVGKTLLAAKIAHTLRAEFDRIYWVSLQSAPSLHHLLQECLHFLTGQPIEQLPTTTSRLNDLFIRHLRAERCLLILDNYDSLNESDAIAGTYRIGYEDYGPWLGQFAELAHRSCLMLTSREKPLEFIPLTHDVGPVRSLHLAAIDLTSFQEILAQRGISGTVAEWQQLHLRYSGNPAILNLVAEPICELFDGDLATFLKNEVALFQVIRDLLAQQFGRLSLLEREALYWLTIEQEAVALETLHDDIGKNVPKAYLLEALRSLLRRSLIEQRSNRFAVPHLIQTYMSERLIDLVVREISASVPLMLAGFALSKTQPKEYIHDIQMREIVQPIMARLFHFASREEIERKLFAMLRTAQQTTALAGAYCAGNLFNLLVQLNADLRGHDFSHLEIHHGDLRTVNLQGANFANSTFRASRFWESFASIAALAFHPAGTYVAAGMTSGELYLWSLKEWELCYRIVGHADMIWSMAFSADGSLLATGSEDHTVCVWDVAGGECLLRVIAHDGWVKGVCFFNNNSWLITAGHDEKVRIWDVTTGECVRSWQAHHGWIWSIAVSPDGNYLATTGHDHSVKIWNLQDYTCVKVLTHHIEPVRAVAFSPDGQTLVSAGFDGVIGILDVATGQCRHLLKGHENLIWAIAFSPDGNEIVSGGDDQQLFIWCATTGHLLRKIEGHQNRLWAIAFHPNGEIIASGGDDQRLHFWSRSDGQSLHCFEGYSNQIWALAYNPHDKTLVASGDDGTVRIWDYTTQKCIHLLQGHTARVRGIACSPDGANLVTGGDDHTVRIWDVKRTLPLHTLYGHQNRIWSVNYDATGKWVISCCEDQTIRIWDAENGQLIRMMQMESGRIWSIASHPIRNLLASSSDNHEILLWDLDTGRCIDAWEGHRARIWHLCFNHDGTLVASGSADHTVCIWDTQSGNLLRHLTGHTNAVWTVAFSPSGRYLASGGDDYRICVWDVASGDLCFDFSGHEGCIWTLTFITETLLASGSQDETIRLWQLSPPAPQQILRSERPYERMDITGVKGLTEAQKISLRALGAIER